MKITTEPLENCQVRLTIEVDEERTQQAMRQVARKIAKQTDIPGFRRGKAPYDVIARRYGEDTLRREAADTLLQTVFREAIEQQQIKPYAPGELEQVELEPLTYTFTVSLPPQVDLGDYREYRLEPPRVEVHQEDVQRVLEKIRAQNAILEPVERPVALNDGALVDLQGRTSQGIPFMRETNTRILLKPGSAEPVPGVAEALVGMKAGEERTFTLTLPYDFPQQELQGQAARFTVELKQVYNCTLPPLDDDLARTAGNFDSLEELEEHVREQLRQAAQREADREYAENVVMDVVESAHVEHPPVLLKETLDEIVEEIEQMVRRETQLPLEEYLRFQGKTLEEMREELKPRAQARVKRALVLGEIVRREGLEVTGEEVSTRIEEVSAPWGIRAGEIRSSLQSEEGQKSVTNRLLGEKAVQRLVAIAKGEAPQPGPAEEPEHPETVSEQTEGDQNDE